MSDVRNFIGAGLRDLKLRLSTGEVIDCYGAVSAEGAPKVDGTDVKGDDALLGTFNSSISEDFTAVLHGLTFDAIQAITGNTAASSATGSTIPLGTDSELSAPFVEVQSFTVAKTKDGAAAYIKKTWRKVQINSLQVSQQGEKEFTATLEGVALQTALDITGATLTPKRISDIAGVVGTYTAS